MVRGCLHVGGRFDRVSDSRGETETRDAARLCLDTQDGVKETWEAIAWEELGREGGQILVIADADVE